MNVHIIGEDMFSTVPRERGDAYKGHRHVQTTIIAGNFWQTLNFDDLSKNGMINLLQNLAVLFTIDKLLNLIPHQISNYTVHCRM